MANEQPDTDAPLSVIERHFGDNADVAQQIVDLINATPDRLWLAEDLLSECRIESPADGYMLIARLTKIGAIAHPGFGLYSAIDTSAQIRTA
jgi:hypothetical protein